MHRSDIALLRAAALLLVTWLLVFRIAGPDDLWDQSQPRTVAYTSDMLEHGRESWLLPRDAAGFAATKPPLYNWIAAPFVMAAGRGSAVAHKAPSILALLATVGLVAMIGERLRPGTGWTAAILLVASYPMVKLGYLARPDMLLVATTTAGWWAFTRLLFDPDAPRRGMLALAWGAVVAAGWAKGPPALLLLIHPVVAALVVEGSLRPLVRIGLWWAVPSAALAAAWPLVAAGVDSAHVFGPLMHGELLDRIGGASAAPWWRGAGAELHLMPLYAMVRFLPWSLITVIALGGAVVVRTRNGRPREFRQAVVESGAVWIVLVVILFSLSVGKRADYVAPAYPVAALLAAWWLVEATDLRRRAVPTVVAGSVTMLALWLTLWRHSPLAPGGQEAIEELERLARDERDVAQAIEPGAPLLALDVAAEQLPATTCSGRPMASSAAAVAALLDTGKPLRLLYDEATAPPEILDRLAELERSGRLRPCWRIDVPWRPEEGEPVRTARCVAVARR